MEMHRGAVRIFACGKFRKIAYAEQGDKNGIPIVFLHGLASSKEPFTKGIFPHLPSYIRAIALDLPGFGESTSAGTVAKCTIGPKTRRVIEQ